MPEDLRQIEEQIKAKQRPSFETDLSEGKKIAKSTEAKPAKPKFNLGAIWSKLFKRHTAEPIVLKAKVSEPIMLVPDKLSMPSIPKISMPASPPASPKPDEPKPEVKPIASITPPIITPVSQMPEVEIKPNAKKYHQPKPATKSQFEADGGVNLIPESLELKSWHEIFNYLLTAVILGAVIVGVIYSILLVQESNLIRQTNLATSQISDLEKEILNFEQTNNKITDLGNQIRLVNDLLNKHIYWTDFFALLEKYTWRDVYYTGFSAGNEGAFTLDAVGPDMEAVASQLKVLQSDAAKEFVQSASITSASRSQNGVEFSITFILNDKLFYYE